MNKLVQFLNDESGVAAIEYGLIVSLISLACIAAMRNVGTELSATFNKASSAMSFASND